jgi:hypothetical protein
MKSLARHSRNQKKLLNTLHHEKHEKHEKKTRHEKEQIHFIPQVREHEVNEVKPGNADLRGFMHFAFGDQRLAVGSRPAGRRWRVTGNNILFAGETRTVPGSPLHPSS